MNRMVAHAWSAFHAFSLRLRRSAIGRGCVKSYADGRNLEVDLSERPRFNDRPFGNTKATFENAPFLSLHTASNLSHL